MKIPSSIRFNEAGHYFYSEGFRDMDFIVYNQDAFNLTEEDILPEDLIQLKPRDLDATINRLKSEAWSSGCRFFFLFQAEGIYFIGVHEESFWLCRKHSIKFIQLYLDAPSNSSTKRKNKK